MTCHSRHNLTQICPSQFVRSDLLLTAVQQVIWNKGQMTGRHLPPCLLAMPRRDKHSVWQHEVCHLHVHLLASGMLLLYRDLREGRCRLGTHWSPQLFPTALPSEILFFHYWWYHFLFISFHSTCRFGAWFSVCFCLSPTAEPTLTIKFLPSCVAYV